jgi:hypothetical protein
MERNASLRIQYLILSNGSFIKAILSCYYNVCMEKRLDMVRIDAGEAWNFCIQIGTNEFREEGMDDSIKISDNPIP